MSDLLASAYPWIKAFHIMAVIAWMAGLFYLPRLFVYHAEQVGQTGDTHALFQTMEMKLLRVIMNPAMISTWIFGLCLVFTPGLIDWSEIWPWIKAAMVTGMTWFHHSLANWRKDFAAGRNDRDGRFFRLANELPTLMMFVIVLMVIGRPF